MYGEASVLREQSVIDMMNSGCEDVVTAVDYLVSSHFISRLFGSEEISASTRQLIDRPQALALSPTWTSNSSTGNFHFTQLPVSANFAPSL